MRLMSSGSVGCGVGPLGTTLRDASAPCARTRMHCNTSHSCTLSTSNETYASKCQRVARIGDDTRDVIEARVELGEASVELVVEQQLLEVGPHALQQRRAVLCRDADRFQIVGLAQVQVDVVGRQLESAEELD